MIGVIDPQPFILTKIIATLGPASEDVPALIKLIEHGVRVFRLNFSHGSPEQHFKFLQAAREASAQIGISVGVLGDLCGPKIRVGQTIAGGVMLNRGDTVHFQREPIIAGEQTDGPVTFHTSYDAMIDEAQIGQRLLIDDGMVHLLIIDKVDDRLICTVTTAGTVSTRKGVNLPQTQLSVPSITDYDWQCVDWAMQNELDFLALSFVRHHEDILQLRAYLQEKVTHAGITPPIIAKIEKPQALDDLEAIIDATDIIMIARGDLGVEMDLALVPIIQKRITKMAHDYGKPVIVATQMLQSMITAATPTRAEVSDVATAIFDGADAVMLSGETAVGEYPLAAVSHMARIARAIQEDLHSRETLCGSPPVKLQKDRYRTAALAHGVAAIVKDLNAKYIIVWSQHGGAARYISQNHPMIPILAASSDLAVLRRMTPLFAVVPLAMGQPKNVEQFIGLMDERLISKKWASVGDPIVIVTGEPLGTAGVTNKVRIHYVGDA